MTAQEAFIERRRVIASGHRPNVDGKFGILRMVVIPFSVRGMRCYMAWARRQEIITRDPGKLALSFYNGSDGEGRKANNIERFVINVDDASGFSAGHCGCFLLGFGATSRALA